MASAVILPLFLHLKEDKHITLLPIVNKVSADDSNNVQYE